MKLDPGAWAIFPQQRVTGNRSHSICHNKVILSPASGRRYRCNSHPLLQKSTLLWALQYMRVSVTWTLQHLLLITVKYRDWGSCRYKLSLQQAWFWCRISLIMFHETSIQKASSWGERVRDGGPAFCCWRKSTLQHHFREQHQHMEGHPCISPLVVQGEKLWGWLTPRPRNSGLTQGLTSPLLPLL